MPNDVPDFIQDLEDAHNAPAEEAQADEAPAQKLADETVVEEAKEALESAETPEEVKEEIRKFLVKVDGEEKEIEESELIRGYQTRAAADKRFREAADLRKRVEELASIFKTDPRKVLREEGIDERALAEEILGEIIEDEILTPEEKAAKAQARKEAAERRERDERLAKFEKAEAERAQKELQDQEFKALNSALATHNLVATPEVKARLQAYVDEAHRINKPVTWEDAVIWTKEDLEKSKASTLGSTDAETLLRLLGPDKVRELAAQLTKDKKDPKKVASTPGTQPKSARSKKKRKFKSWDEHFAHLKD